MVLAGKALCVQFCEELSGNPRGLHPTLLQIVQEAIRTSGVPPTETFAEGTGYQEPLAGCAMHAALLGDASLQESLVV